MLNQGVLPKTDTAGKTLDLSVLIAIRAVETTVRAIWKSSWHDRSQRNNFRSRVESAIANFIDPIIFALSSSLIMWSWFYLPYSLPDSYRKWIGRAANIDEKLLRVLRNAREGIFVYGRDNDQANILQPICTHNALPIAWADPARSIPIPCEVVHCGSGPSCFMHGLMRFIRSFRFSLSMYLPIQILIRLRDPSARNLARALRDALRSSVFLGAFIGLFYYSVCFCRTTLGPLLFRRNIMTPQTMDGGFCVAMGCFVSGFSVMIEKPSRRSELAFFVAPRALGTMLPREFDRQRVRDSRSVNVNKLILYNSIYGRNN